ncbi:MAG: hypothetical protein VKS61_14465 [Candidatus Sericytochromatia bacterium]|nr:hypothetical protein [Candidatus Sericytochromatia bacterium]
MALRFPPKPGTSGVAAVLLGVLLNAVASCTTPLQDEPWRPAAACPAQPSLPPGWSMPAKARSGCPFDDPSGQAQLAVAQALRTAGHPADATPWLRKALAQGSSEARVELARLLLGEASLDEGALAEARGLLTQAGEAGLYEALLLLAGTYTDPPSGSPDPAQAARWLARADAAGYATGTYELGKLTERDSPQQALELYHKAAKQGHGGSRGALALTTAGQLRLAWMYERGEGVPADPCETITWYVRAASGKPPAEEALAWVTAHVVKDPLAARGAATTSGEAGLTQLVAQTIESSSPACATQLYLGLPEVDAEAVQGGLKRIGARYEAEAPARAVAYYGQLADAGAAPGMPGLARLCEAGRDQACMAAGQRLERQGLTDRADETYETAADRGHQPAAQALGALRCREGSDDACQTLGRQQEQAGDLAQALAWYAVAEKRGHKPAFVAVRSLKCKAGDNEACLSLGGYFEGAGNSGQAADWYRVAAQRGHQRAAEALDQLRCRAGENEACLAAGRREERMGDRLDASAWYQIASRRGYLPAKDALELMACEAGDDEACMRLGRSLQHRGEVRRLVEAYQPAVKRLYVPAMLELATLYDRSVVCCGGATQAGSLYRMAANTGSAEGAYRLGMWLPAGHPEACQWLGRAALLGHGPASREAGSRCATPSAPLTGSPPPRAAPVAPSATPWIYPPVWETLRAGWAAP